MATCTSAPLEATGNENSNAPHGSATTHATAPAVTTTAAIPSQGPPVAARYIPLVVLARLGLRVPADTAGERAGAMATLESCWIGSVQWITRAEPNCLAPWAPTVQR